MRLIKFVFFDSLVMVMSVHSVTVNTNHNYKFIKQLHYKK